MTFGEYFCGVCDIKCGTDDKIWIECEQCSIWYHLECVNINKQSIPDVFACFECSAYVLDVKFFVFHNPILCTIIPYVNYYGIVCH